jgi:hypothetical protein
MRNNIFRKGKKPKAELMAGRINLPVNPVAQKLSK